MTLTAQTYLTITLHLCVAAVCAWASVAAIGHHRTIIADVDLFLVFVNGGGVGFNFAKLSWRRELDKMKLRNVVDPRS